MQLPSCCISSVLTYSRETAMSNAASISMIDPREISKNLFLSTSEFRDAPLQGSGVLKVPLFVFAS